MAADIRVKGFPDIFGTKKADCWDHFGPASYTTGGEEFPPGGTNGGLNGYGSPSIYNIPGELVTEDGLYRLLPQFPTDGSAPMTVLIKWIVISSGDEVAADTDLSGSHMRVSLIGG